MPYYRRALRYPYGRSRGSYRRGYRRYYRRNWPRLGGGSNFTTGRKLMNLRVPVEDIFQFTIPDGANWSDLLVVCPYVEGKPTKTGAFGPWKHYGFASAVSSPLYRTYSRLFDLVKCNSVFVEMSVLDGVGIGGSLSALQCYTAWDRKGGFSEVAPGGQPSFTTETIGIGSESQTNLIVNNSRQKLYRSNRASDLQERITYHDCDISFGNVGGVQAVNLANQGLVCADQAYMDFYYDTVSENPPILSPKDGQDIGYVPCLSVAFYSPVAAAGAAIHVNVSFKVNWNFTFRNPKYGLTVGQNKGVEGVRDLTADPVSVPVAGKGVKVESVLDDEEMDEKGPDTEEKGSDPDEKEVRTDMTDEEISALLEKLRVSKEKT